MSQVRVEKPADHLRPISVSSGQCALPLKLGSFFSIKTCQT